METAVSTRTADMTPDILSIASVKTVDKTRNSSI